MKNITSVFTKCIEDYVQYDALHSIEDLVITMFETILKCERKVFLANCEEPNKANGYYPRMARAITKFFQINVPRDRQGMFKPLFLEVIKEHDQQLMNLAAKLYVKGLTTRDIEDVFDEIFDKKISPSQVSLISKNFQEERDIFLTRKLQDEYYFIYIDALYTSIRRGTVEKEAVYIVVGLNMELKREILGIYNIPTESASGWGDVIKDLKDRGLKQVLMVVADGLSGLETVVKNELPLSKLQKCIVHKNRNILLRARTSDKAELGNDLRKVFELENPTYTKIEGITRLDKFITKWKPHYPQIRQKFKEEHLENYFAYLDFPAEIQRMIYTTNWIERLNKAVRRTIKIRNSFPNPASALNLITSALMDYEENVYKYPVTSFLKVKDKLDIMFKKFDTQTQLI